MTVSKNGMVMNGELVPLETLARECDIYKKLMKIDFFSKFTKHRSFGRWKESTKKNRFLGSCRNISNLLDLDDQKLLLWKIELFNDFEVGYKGGWLKEGWVPELVESLSAKK